MTLERFKELFGEQLNAKAFAEAVGTSEGHVNELRRKPNAKDIAETFGLLIEDVEEVLNRPNLDAIYNFMVNKNVELTDEQIELIQQKTKRERKALEFVVGLETPLGVIAQVQKIGKTNVYMIKKADGTFELYGTQELKDSYNTDESEEDGE